MKPERFNKFFSYLEKLPASLIAKNIKPKEDYFRIKNDMPILDALDLLERYECLILENGDVITKEQTMSKPVKTIFYALIIEVEYRLYKVLKEKVKSPEELQRLEFNDLIKMFLLHDDLLKKQSVYSEKQNMKKDLKAISSFRNVVMHSPRKVDLSTRYDIIIKRKKQALNLLEALGQIYPKSNQ
ncbi:hypothetical protein HYT57_00285 [Candidatus Woesearchaeota archaeon]|nr:hypothetical protein [Candidatus Woesearchaeota archaeon]